MTVHFRICLSASKISFSVAVTTDAATKSAQKASLRGTRGRQSTVRLKLPLEPCLAVARKLVKLLCDLDEQLSVLTKVVICKVSYR